MENGLFIGAPEDSDAARLDRVRGLLQGVGRVLDLAAILARSGRRIDLVGIDRKVGLLCAQTLDLPPEMGRSLVADLEAQITMLDRLADIIKPHRR